MMKSPGGACWRLTYSHFVNGTNSPLEFFKGSLMAPVLSLSFLPPTHGRSKCDCQDTDRSVYSLLADSQLEFPPLGVGTDVDSRGRATFADGWMNVVEATVK
jgi:hypothetical protein